MKNLGVFLPKKVAEISGRDIFINTFSTLHNGRTLALFGRKTAFSAQIGRFWSVLDRFGADFGSIFGLFLAVFDPIWASIGPLLEPPGPEFRTFFHFFSFSALFFAL